MSDLDLSNLDDSNDSHWTAEGEPALAAVQSIVGRKVDREAVRATRRLRGKAQARNSAAAKQAINHQLEIGKAELAVAEQRARLSAIRVKVKAARAAYAEAVMAWQKVAAPLPPDEAYREHLRRTAEHAKSGNVARPIAPVYRSRLDEVMAGATRKSHDVTGSTRPRARGLIR
ncbi:hypothetical protein ABIB00_002151 [Bradyrhizobium sp. LB14.3]|uniref:hypothetical protein n=1 Tax=Bradyrhizobium sp. LB14.3 TaxID=3156328 RepID=UPI0033919ADA